MMLLRKQLEGLPTPNKFETLNLKFESFKFIFESFKNFFATFKIKRDTATRQIGYVRATKRTVEDTRSYKYNTDTRKAHKFYGCLFITHTLLGSTLEYQKIII